jgi:hypothetical protein
MRRGGRRGGLWSARGDELLSSPGGGYIPFPVRASNATLLAGPPRAVAAARRGTQAPGGCNLVRHPGLSTTLPRPQASRAYPIDFSDACPGGQPFRCDERGGLRSQPSPTLPRCAGCSARWAGLLLHPRLSAGLAGRKERVRVCAQHRRLVQPRSSDRFRDHDSSRRSRHLPRHLSRLQGLHPRQFLAAPPPTERELCRAGRSNASVTYAMSMLYYCAPRVASGAYTSTSRMWRFGSGGPADAHRPRVLQMYILILSNIKLNEIPDGFSPITWPTI